MKTDRKILKIRTLISEGKIAEALQEIRADQIYYSRHGQDLDQLSAMYETNERERMRSIITQTEYSHGRNRITALLLDKLREISAFYQENEAEIY